MSREFDGATQLLTLASAVVTTAPYTFAAWIRLDVVNALQAPIAIHKSSDPNNVATALNLMPDGTMRAWSSSTLAGAGATSTTTVSASTWTHVCGVWAAADSRSVFINGTDKQTNTTSVTPLLLDTTQIGRYDLTTQYLDGLVAEAAIWSVALDDAEVASLAKGFSPPLVRPQSIAAYWPLFGNASPEPDRWKNRSDMTVTGATKADHTRMYYPHDMS